MAWAIGAQQAQDGDVDAEAVPRHVEDVVDLHPPGPRDLEWRQGAEHPAVSADEYQGHGSHGAA